MYNTREQEIRLIFIYALKNKLRNSVIIVIKHKM